MKPVKHNMSTPSKSSDKLKPLPPNAWLSLRPNQQVIEYTINISNLDQGSYCITSIPI